MNRLSHSCKPAYNHLSFRENGCVEPRAGAIIYLSILDSLVGVLRWCFRNPRYCSTGDSFYLPPVGRYKVSVSFIPPVLNPTSCPFCGAVGGFLFLLYRKLFIEFFLICLDHFIFWTSIFHSIYQSWK